MNPPTLSGYWPYIVSALIGLQMLWTEIMRGKNSRLQSKTIDQTAMSGKQIDDSIAWRKDILEADKSLRTDLGNAYKLIGEINGGQTVKINTVIETVNDLVDKFTDLTSKFGNHDERMANTAASVKKILEMMETKDAQDHS